MKRKLMIASLGGVVVGDRKVYDMKVDANGTFLSNPLDRLDRGEEDDD